MSRIADWPIASVTADDLERFKETRLREHQQAAVVALLRRRQKAHDDDNPADAATCDVCRRLTERQNGGHVTINRNLALLRAMWNWAILKGHTERTPFKVGPVTAVHLFREYRRHRRSKVTKKHGCLPRVDHTYTRSLSLPSKPAAGVVNCYR